MIGPILEEREGKTIRRHLPGLIAEGEQHAYVYYRDFNRSLEDTVSVEDVVRVTVIKKGK
jgi:hypothetical protein